MREYEDASLKCLFIDIESNKCVTVHMMVCMIVFAIVVVMVATCQSVATGA
jgi:hypothetical protein